MPSSCPSTTKTRFEVDAGRVAPGCTGPVFLDSAASIFDGLLQYVTTTVGTWGQSSGASAAASSSTPPSMPGGHSSLHCRYPVGESQVQLVVQGSPP